MSSSSILRRIARHGVSLVRDPREDRLTEIWAAIFDDVHCEGFARHVALDWVRVATSDAAGAERERLGSLVRLLDQEGEWRCNVETQVPTTVEEERRRPDLELTFTGPASVSVWVEVKHGTPPHDGQLSAYRHAQRARGLTNAAVLLVAPRADHAWFPPDELPQDVPCLSWEQTAQSIRGFSGTGDPVQRFLLEELWSYMSAEQLTDPPRLTLAHVAALASYRDARTALERLCDLAANRLGDTWGGTGEPGTYPERGEPRQYWWSHQPDDAGRLLGGEWWWDWKLLLDSTDILKDGDRRPAVFVGVTADPGSLARLDEGVKEALARADFRMLGPGASNARNDYVLKFEYLDAQLVGDGELQGQAHVLAGWLEKAFSELQQTIGSAS